MPKCYGKCGPCNNDAHKCCKYFIANRNPFDVGVSKQLDKNRHLLLLSGNLFGRTDIDADGLPDWVATGNRPCKFYDAISTHGFCSMWNKSGGPFHRSPPNAFVTFTNTSGHYLSTAIRVVDCKLEKNGHENTVAITYKYLKPEDDTPSLDRFDTRVFKVNFSFDSGRAGKALLASRKHLEAHRSQQQQQQQQKQQEQQQEQQQRSRQHDNIVFNIKGNHDTVYFDMDDVNQKKHKSCKQACKHHKGHKKQKCMQKCNHQKKKLRSNRG